MYFYKIIKNLSVESKTRLLWDLLRCLWKHPRFLDCKFKASLQCSLMELPIQANLKKAVKSRFPLLSYLFRVAGANLLL
jgi:hypothetical protein